MCRLITNRKLLSPPTDFSMSWVPFSPETAASQIITPREYRRVDGLTSNGTTCIKTNPNRPGIAWVEKAAKGTSMFPDDRFNSCSVGISEYRQQINHTYADRNGNLWWGTCHGVYSIVDSRVARYDFSFHSPAISPVTRSENGTAFFGIRMGIYCLAEGRDSVELPDR
jgi:hypothetical protein